jgi:hypothetical protein
MCFVRISEQTAITFLYSVNRLVFTTEKQSVYCAVHAGSLYIKQIRFVFKGLSSVSHHCRSSGFDWNKKERESTFMSDAPLTSNKAPVRSPRPLVLLIWVALKWRCLRSIGGMILSGGNRSTRRKTHPSATSSTTNFTWANSVSNPWLKLT